MNTFCQPIKCDEINIFHGIIKTESRKVMTVYCLDLMNQVLLGRWIAFHSLFVRLILRVFVFRNLVFFHAFERRSKRTANKNARDNLDAGNTKLYDLVMEVVLAAVAALQRRRRGYSFSVSHLSSAFLTIA